MENKVFFSYLMFGCISENIEMLFSDGNQNAVDNIKNHAG